MNIEIANKLVELRKAHGLSQEALAEKLGLSRQAISKWERAEASPDTDNLVTLASLYNVSLDEILCTSTNRNAKRAKKEKVPKLHLPKTKRQELGIKMCKFPMPLFAIAIFLILGFCFHWWHPGWLILLTIPIYYWLAGALCCRSNKAMLLAAPFPAVPMLIFLLVGIITGLWHPMWLIFLTVPLYYWLVSLFYKDKEKTK